MTKKLIHIIIVLAVVLVGAASYLAAIILPVKINIMIVEELERAVGKKVLIETIRFDMFKGLVLGDLIIYDRNSIIIWAKSVSCGIPLSPLFNNKLAIPSITINSPAIYLERRSDNSFNVAELMPAKYSPNAAAAVALKRLIVKNARVLFVDRTLDPAFRERINDISMDVELFLPDKIALNISGNIPAENPIYFKFSGIYSIAGSELAGQAGVKGLDLNEFRQYYKSTGISFPEGKIDASMDVRVKDEEVELSIDGSIDNLSIEGDGFNIRLDSLIKMMALYTIKDKKMEYAGKLDVSRMDLAGIEGVGKLENIKADIEFDDSRLWSENIIADAYGMIWKARVNIVNYASPIFDIYADSEGRLSVIQKMLDEEFNIKLPTDISGKAGLSLAIQAESGKPLRMNGYITLHDATISLGEGNFPIEGVTGEAQFNLDGVRWSEIKLKYRGTPYVSSGKLADFASPKVELETISQSLTFRSTLSVRGNAVKVSRLEGRYFSSPFSAAGGIDFPDRKPMKADIDGTLELELKDLKKMVKNSAGLQKMKPDGKIVAQFSLNGNLSDLKSCGIRAKIKSAYMAIYGLKLTDMSADYAQSGGVGQIRTIMSRFYGGSLYGSGKIDLAARALPYSFNIDAKDVSLEKLRTDIGLKDKDISGGIKALANVSGTFKDITRLSGNGRVSITNGRLWQSNLFKGIGSIIFSSDFSDIVFTEGSCDIKIINREFLINNFTLKSELLNLYGSGTIGFDNSVNALLRPEVRESPMGSDTQERIAMAVSGNTVIKITGTIEKPEYKTQSNLADVMGGIAGAIFQQ